ncbi:MAG: alpha/beta fold hydrolase [Actinomycetia bacterium]|nr:alpha/beta fold hydrolase [Actinomycetes bacterium]
MSDSRPEISRSIQTGSFNTNYHDYGSGEAVLLIHGSGPGVSAWANWQKILPTLSAQRRVLAPDMVGFGYSDRPAGLTYNMEVWTQQVIDFLDALQLDQVDLVGNSFGGALALSLAIEHPQRIRKLVLMGSMGVNFTLQPDDGLDAVWGYTPSLENMRKLIKLFAWNPQLQNDENLARMRYEGSLQPGFQESFGSMFPAPRQRWVAAMAKHEAQIPDIQQPTLVICGREDRVIPMETSLKIFSLIANAQLHIFGHCGHWTQIEQTDRFVQLVENFLAE